MLFDKQTEIDTLHEKFILEDLLVDMKRNLSKIDFDSPNSNIYNDVCNLITTVPLKEFSITMCL